MQDYKYQLSVIIPMYNAEKYIGACLDSILSSGLQRDTYEMIVVNDGSTDKGPEIVQDYAARYDHITYLTQENQGQSTARNFGICQCHGEYVWCVDADDKVNDEAARVPFLLKAYPDIDILAVQLQDTAEDGTLLCKSCEQPSMAHDKAISGRDAVLQGYNPSSVCALVVRRGLMMDKDLFFHVGITHQDVELSYRLMAYANRVVFTNLAPYVYLYHFGSTSKSLDPQKKIKYLSDDCVIIESFRKLSDNFRSSDPQLSAVIDDRVRAIHFGMAYNLWGNRRQWKSAGINKGVIQRMKERGLFPLPHRLGSWKKDLISYLLNCSWLYA
ncbi:glycosyltransferase [Hallella multisaccharivorax DSM 17128]|uniref:Glycosyl transferase family 2 n=1 Tax=Hallella multisaccharivorax DSM 17128 TaxID=688246 RepID=F8N8U0_9BACT|nr:glycosyltransferase [Hallella multisaccharivorax]EGN57685.1 glycosyl transferase family 2 [Hallella multisaccharivorax DSM 17128]GJG31053.1 glycosyltransferase [Hallella multisaccharivorax DSM 17128]